MRRLPGREDRRLANNQEKRLREFSMSFAAAGLAGAREEARKGLEKAAKHWTRQWEAVGDRDGLGRKGRQGQSLRVRNL